MCLQKYTDTLRLSKEGTQTPLFRLVAVAGYGILFREPPNCQPYDNKLLALFEAKESGREIAPAIRYFGRMLKIPCYQIVRDLEKSEAFPDNCFLLPAASFLMLAG
jgi:hypothetical protein